MWLVHPTNAVLKPQTGEIVHYFSGGEKKSMKVAARKFAQQVSKKRFLILRAPLTKHLSLVGDTKCFSTKSGNPSMAITLD